MRRTSMNIAPPCYSGFFGVASSRTGERFDTVEVRSSSLLVPTISFKYIRKPAWKIRVH